ncbi:hypothetical protein [Sphingomonas sp. 3-13AW]|uniref:hypothetical protein n=1 Tax=Sphingomonas sp. 3-13AW TaxID=3050450 RepID=UPI003BB70DC7
MKTDLALTQTARAAVLAHGFHPAVADLVDVIRHPAREGDVEHVEIRWSYPAVIKGKDKRVAVAISYIPTLTFEESLSAGSVADTVIAIRPTLPASLRDIEVPAWAASRGTHVRSFLGKARSLSESAAFSLAA